MNSKLWLIGCGGMSVDYAKVLNALNCNFEVIGRGETSALAFQEKVSKEVIQGGLDAFIATKPKAPELAIVSVGVEQLATTTIALLNLGVKKILVEKPAGLNLDEIAEVNRLSEQQGAEIFVAYNRRFFSAVKAAQQIIEEDGGVESFNFELTEWGHVVRKIKKAEGVLENWFLANTTHVVDLAFFLGGKPTKLSSFTSGGTDWHSRSSNFCGAGLTHTGALFCYNGNWSAPGRWSVEVLTSKHRLILRPMEQLQLQKIVSVEIDYVDINDALDIKYKPGLFDQVEKFVSAQYEGLCSIKEQLEMVAYYEQMAGYRSLGLTEP